MLERGLLKGFAPPIVAYSGRGIDKGAGLISTLPLYSGVIVLGGLIKGALPLLVGPLYSWEKVEVKFGFFREKVEIDLRIFHKKDVW